MTLIMELVDGVWTWNGDRAFGWNNVSLYYN